MSRLLIAGYLCVVIAACAASHEWVKPGMTASTREADLTACSSRTSHLASDDSMAISIMDSCMASRGYDKKVVR